jgi:hypothetical protein
MFKKSLGTLIVGVLLASAGLTAVAHAATISNGAKCAKLGASTIVKVKGVSKTYVCKINPTVANTKIPTWTLKTCLNYWVAAQDNQDSINQQRELVQLMTDPDKTNYNKQLNASQVSLNKVITAIKANYCKKGL